MRHPARRTVAVTLCALLLATLGATPVAARTKPAGFAPGAPSAVTDAKIRLELVANGLSKPVLVTHAGDGSGRLFVVEKTGKVRIIKNGKLLPGAFIDLSRSVSKGGEQGLLGLAFHPFYTSNRKFYVSYTNLAGDSVINEYRASATNPDIVQSGSGRRVMTVDQPYANHNGGHIAFGPGAVLYIGFGDGGSAGDPGNRAQSLSSLLGKMLRINVNGSTSTRGYLIPSSNPYVGRTGLDEIWSRGLRNPWRWSFDRKTGDLWIADVGQAKYEEVNRNVRTSTTHAGRGVNYGWKVMEGRHCYSPSTGCSTSGKQLPLTEYAHASGRCSVTGGYVYRGTAIPALVGGYLYADYCTGEIFVLSSTAAAPATGTRLLDTTMLISSFGEDQAGELYVCDINGAVYRIVAA